MERLRLQRQNLSEVTPYNNITLHNALYKAGHSALRGLDYGRYMDTGDGLGLDDVAGYDYGYDDALGNAIDWLVNAGSDIIGAIGSAGSAVGSAIGSIGTGAWSLVTKLPGIAVDAWKYAKTGAKAVYGWASTSNITAPVRWAVAGGKAVGKWVWDGVKWLFKDNSGNNAKPPAGVSNPNSSGAVNISIPGGNASQGGGAGAGNTTNVYVGQPQNEQGQQYTYVDPGTGQVTTAQYPPNTNPYINPVNAIIGGGTAPAEITSVPNAPILPPETENKTTPWIVVAGAVVLGALLL